MDCEGKRVVGFSSGVIQCEGNSLKNCPSAEGSAANVINQITVSQDKASDSPLPRGEIASSMVFRQKFTNNLSGNDDKGFKEDPGENMWFRSSNAMGVIVQEIEVGG
jgi:hypothetical protein